MGKKITMWCGWIFIVLGLFGFVSNPIIGTNGFFLTNTAHNIVHLLSGIIFLWVAYSASAKIGTLLKTFGIIYLIIAILGFIGSGSVIGIMATNTADNWLNVILGIIFVWAGWSGTKPAMPSGAPMGGQQM